MRKFNQQKNKQLQLEQKLSRLGVLVANASQDVFAAKISVEAAESKLHFLQKEIEKMYVTLNEPILKACFKTK